MFYKKFISLCKQIPDRNLVTANGGNVSIKHKDKIYITSKGSRLSNLSKKDIVSFNIKDTFLSNKNKKISSEWRIHFECYKKRKDVKSIVHTHSTYCILLGVTLKKQMPVSYETVSVLDSKIKTIDYLHSGTSKLAKKIAEEIKTSNAVIIAGHGLITVGKNLQEVIDRSIVLEKEAKLFIMYKILNNMNLIDQKIVDSIKNIVEV